MSDGVDNKDSEKSGKQSDDKSQLQNNDKPKLYEESVVKEIIAERDKVKEKLRKLESQSAEQAKQREEETLKAKNDFEGLTKLHQAEYERAINSAKSLIVNNYLTSMAVKNGINEPADVALFNFDLELDDDYSVTNGEAVEKAFQDFKKAKPYLFKTEDNKKPVPRTHNSPVSNQAGNAPVKISALDILKEQMSTKK